MQKQAVVEFALQPGWQEKYGGPRSIYGMTGLDLFLLKSHVTDNSQLTISRPSIGCFPKVRVVACPLLHRLHYILYLLIATHTYSIHTMAEAIKKVFSDKRDQVSQVLSLIPPIPADATGPSVCPRDPEQARASPIRRADCAGS